MSASIKAKTELCRYATPLALVILSGMILTPGATPATPMALLATAAMVPATWVPCPLSSDGSASQLW